MHRVLIVAGLALAVAAGIAVAAWSPSRITILILLVALLLTAPILVRLAQRRFDILEPIVWINAALAVMFVVRPTAILHYDPPSYRFRFDPAPATFDDVLVVVLVGVLAMYAAYFSGFARRIATLIPSPATTYRREVLVSGAFAAAGLGVVLYSIFAFRTGVSPLTLIFGGPQAAQFEATAYLYLAPFMIVPAALIMLKLGITERRPLVTLFAVVAMVTLVNSLAPQGQRLWLLVVLSSLALYPMLRSGWRPGPAVVLAIAAVGLIFTVSMRDLSLVRNDQGVGEAVVHTLQHPQESFKELVTGPDTEMHNSFALLLDLMPEQYDFQPGHAVTSLVAHPIPRILWPGKPYPMESIVNPELYGIRAGDASAAYSVMGGFYYDSGLIGVAVGMFVIGLAWRALFDWLQAAQGRDMAYVVYALTLPFSIVLLRGNLPDTAGRALFVIGPAVVIAYLASARQPSGVRARAPRLA